MTRRTSPHLPAVLSLGVVCQIAQVVVLREFLAVFHGNELSFGLILAAWMLWVGLGSRAAGSLAERFDAARAVGMVVPAVLVLLPATVLAIRLLRPLAAVPPGAHLSIATIAAASFTIVAPVGFLLGTLFVLLTRGWRLRDGAAGTTTAGKSYIAEASGHAVGGLVFTLLLAGRLNSFEAMTAAGVLMAAAALVVMRDRRVPLMVVAAVSAGSLPALGMVDEWAHRLHWAALAPRHELVDTVQSRYGAVSLARLDGQYSFFQSGNLLFSAAGSGATSPPLEEQEAVVTAHLAMAQHPDPRRVLLLGGGLRGVLREVVRYPSVRVDYVELDPVVTTLARRHLPGDAVAALDRADVAVTHGDGRLFLKETGRRYDLIVVDAPDPATAVLNRYYTEEFFRLVSAKLAPGGVIALSVVSTPDLRGSEIVNRNATIYHTLRRVFARVLPVGERTLFYFATDDPRSVSADAAQLRERFARHGIAPPGFPPAQFDLLLLEEPLRRVNWIVRNHGRTDDAHRLPPDAGPLLLPPVAEQERLEAELPPANPRFFVNSDFRPIGYVHTLAFWNRITRTDRVGVFRWLLTVEPWWIVPPAAAVVAASALLGRARRRRGIAGVGRFALLVAVFTTGLSTMTLQVALLFAFQSVYGFVYEMAGAIVAAFMAGLALGTAGTQRFVRERSSPRILMVVQLAIAACAAAIAVLLPYSAAVARPAAQLALFFGATLLAGFLNGVDFPLAAACVHSLDGRAERATGTVYGVELFGACGGAVAAGVIVAPVLGVAACCLLAAIGNGTAFLALLVSGGIHGTHA